MRIIVGSSLIFLFDHYYRVGGPPKVLGSRVQGFRIYGLGFQQFRLKGYCSRVVVPPIIVINCV